MSGFSIYNILRNSALWRLAVIYRDGFRHNKLARKLLLLIIIKVIVIFALFRLFLLPNILNRDYGTGEEKAGAVRNSLIDRSANAYIRIKIIHSKS